MAGVWMTTEVNPRARSAGFHGGRSSWKLHFVEGVAHSDSAPVRGRRSLCGTLPAYGWGVDLFISDRCRRCEARLASKRSAIACPSEDFGGAQAESERDRVRRELYLKADHKVDCPVASLGPSDRLRGIVVCMCGAYAACDQALERLEVESEREAVVRETYEPGGYGGTNYEVEGDLQGVTQAIARINGQFPTPGYGTWFNWPPGKLTPQGKPISYLAPTDLGDGRWVARGHRSNSCD